MGRAPCCDKANVKKGPWSPEEDAKLKDYIEKYGTGGNWIALPQKAGLKRCGKSCRLRWLNYLRPNIKHGEFSDEEDAVICNLYASIGSRWSIIAAQLPGRTDNDIKNYWNTKLKKKIMGMASGNYNTNFTLQLSDKIKAHDQFQLRTSPTSFHLQPPFIFQPSSPSSSSPPAHAQPPPSSSSLLLSPALSSSSPFNNSNSSLSYYSTPATTTSTLSFAGFEQSSLLSHSSSCLSTSASRLLQQATAHPKEDGFNFNPPMQRNYPVFGCAPEASCSSSDGSCNNNINHKRISHGKDFDYDHYRHHEDGVAPKSSTGEHENSFQGYDYGYLYNRLVEEQEHQEAILTNGLIAENSQNNTSGNWGDTQLDYGLEEIKQLISTTNSAITATTNSGSLACNNSNFNSLCFDENKTGDGVITYY